MVLHNSFSWNAFFLFRINILIFSFLLESVLPSNSTRYEACKPTNCGTDLNINFPFYVFGTETDRCGYPGLGIVCNRGKPVYRTLERQYVIQDIFYENQTFRLFDEEFANNSCFPPPYKFSFQLSFLEFTPNDAKLFFFNNCTAPLSVSFQTSLIPCSSRATNSSFVALVKKDEQLSESTACRPSAIVPVEVEGGNSNQTIKKCWHWNGEEEDTIVLTVKEVVGDVGLKREMPYVIASMERPISFISFSRWISFASLLF